MSRDERRLTPSGLRLDDAAQLYQLFNEVAAKIARPDISYKTIARRMRVLSGWLGETADDLSGVSSEERGVSVADSFWRRRQQGERGD